MEKIRAKQVSKPNAVVGYETMESQLCTLCDKRHPPDVACE